MFSPMWIIFQKQSLSIQRDWFLFLVSINSYSTFFKCTATKGKKSGTGYLFVINNYSFTHAE